MAALYISIQVFCVVALAAALILAVVKPVLSKTLCFPLLVASALIYAIGSAFLATATHFDGAWIARQVTLLGLPFIAPLFYMFTRRYFNRTLRNKPLVIALFIVPVVSLVVSLAWPHTTLYYTSLTLNTTRIVSQLVASYGPMYFVANGYSAICYVLALIVILRGLQKPYEGSVGRSSFLLGISFTPALAYAANALGLTGSLDLVPLTFAVSILVFEFFTIRYRSGDWMPYARDHVLQNINDAYVLLDTRNRLVDCNSLAAQYFPKLKNLAVGSDIAEVPGFPLPKDTTETSNTEFCIKLEGEHKYLRASSSPIFQGSRQLCTCIMVYDITAAHKLMEELNQLATQDSLTGLLNRSTFFTQVEKYFTHCKVSGVNCALLMLDIDYFKKVNDKYGHQCGDMVLERVCETISRTLRESDIVGRYGGEEICVFLPTTGPGGALTVAENLRKVLKAESYEWEGESFSITVSIGLAFLSQKRHATLDELVADADKALYKAKQNGRDRVCVEGHVTKAIL